MNKNETQKLSKITDFSAKSLLLDPGCPCECVPGRICRNRVDPAFCESAVKTVENDKNAFGTLDFFENNGIIEVATEERIGSCP